MENVRIIPEDLIDMKECLAVTHYKKGTIYNLVSKGQIPYYKRKTGRKLFFSKSELLSWLQTNKFVEV